MEQYYTVEKVAKMLTMHPKTIQRYIREGKLHAKKVGKSWRIFEKDLKDFMEDSDLHNDNSSKTQSKALVSSVVDIEVQDSKEAFDIEKYLMATMNSKSDELGNTAIHIQYLEYENKLRVTLWGNILFMQRIFELLAVIIKQ